MVYTYLCSLPGQGFPPGMRNETRHTKALFDYTKTENGFKIRCVCLGQIFWNQIRISETMKPAPDSRWRTAMGKYQLKLQAICLSNSQSTIWQ